MYKLFLKYVKQPDHIPELIIADIISTKDYINRWKSRREKTSSNRSGQHFVYSKIQHTSKIKYKYMFATMANITYHTVYSVKRLQKFINLLIMKGSTDYSVNRIRLIPLNEMDQNENSEQIARDTMSSAVIYSILINE